MSNHNPQPNTEGLQPLPEPVRKKEMTMQRSESVDQLYTALAAAQGEMKPAILDTKGNYGWYASLTSVQESYRGPLAKHGLTIMQPIRSSESGYVIDTILGHKSGQWISTEFKLILDRQNMQGLGSAITYARRYSISSLIGIVDVEDDDGQAAVGEGRSASEHPPGARRPPDPQNLQTRPGGTAAPKPPPRDETPATPAAIGLVMTQLRERQLTGPELTLYMEVFFGRKDTSKLTKAHVAHLEAIAADPNWNVAKFMAKVETRRAEIEAKKRLAPG